LESRPNELIKVVQESVFNLQQKRTNWFRSYWAIFDIAWVTEAALIQLCVNSAKQRNGVKAASPTADDIKHLRITQKEIWDWIRSSSATTLDDWPKTATNSISDIVLTQCHSNDCRCPIALSTQLSRQVRTSQLTLFISGNADAEYLCRPPRSAKQALLGATGMTSPSRQKDPH
jgi:hypothetical protein